MHAPIAVFDSGLGGLSVLRAIRDRLPDEPLLYLADRGHAPYGDRPLDFIRARSVAVVRAALAHGAKEIVIACNTATVVAVEALRAEFAVPIVALEPAIKPAVERSQAKVVGVFATSRTIESPAVARLVAQFGTHARIILQACPGWVEQVERGAMHSAETRALVERHLAAPLAAGADTLVLGCTHYAFLRDVIQSVAGPGVTLIDSAEAVARQTERRLPFRCESPGSAECRTELFLASGDVAEATARIRALWHPAAEVRTLP